MSTDTIAPETIHKGQTNTPATVASAPPKQIVNSFDIFDTLLARTVADPTEIFDHVEQAGVANFKADRMQAQAESNHTWQDIYAQYQRITGNTDAEIQRIKALELDAERKATYLVEDVYKQVRDGDILVSDMYLPPDDIASLLLDAGFTKSVMLYVSPAGKASGQIWQELAKQYLITHHSGDNLHSDVNSPAQHGIIATHIRRTAYSNMEAYLHNQGAKTLAALIRRLRLTTPHNPYTREFRLHDVQAMCNLPVLLLLCKELRDMTVKESLNRILFSMRDSTLILPLIRLIYPEIDSVEFQCSRIAYRELTDNYLNYLKNQYEPGNTLIFDLHGAFLTGRTLFQQVFGELPRVHIVSYAELRAPRYDGISSSYSGNNSIELLNLDDVGPLVSVNAAGQPIRSGIRDYDPEIGKVYRGTLSRFMELIQPHLANIRTELASLPEYLPWHDISQLISATVFSDTDLSRIIPEEHYSLTALANHFNTDKGSTFKCAHHYTRVYEQVLMPYVGKDHFSLLEIGLNRDHQAGSPSITMWKNYFGHQVTLYGMDIDPIHSAQHNPAGGIHIIIGDQSNPDDLAQCIAARPEGFDVIIDDGYHATQHQQITLKSLWKAVLPGGLFIIEDLHYQPVQDPSITTRALLTEWSSGVITSSPYITQDEARSILKDVAKISFFDSTSPNWPDDVRRNALVIIQKR